MKIFRWNFHGSPSAVNPEMLVKISICCREIAFCQVRHILIDMVDMYVIVIYHL